MKLGIQKVKICDIKYQNRSPNTNYPLRRLIKSIQKQGMVNPIVVNQDMILIDGLLRLTACNTLKMKSIWAQIVE